MLSPSKTKPIGPTKSGLGYNRVMKSFASPSVLPYKAHGTVLKAKVPYANGTVGRYAFRWSMEKDPLPVVRKEGEKPVEFPVPRAIQDHVSKSWYVLDWTAVLEAHAFENGGRYPGDDFFKGFERGLGWYCAQRLILQAALAFAEQAKTALRVPQEGVGSGSEKQGA